MFIKYFDTYFVPLIKIITLASVPVIKMSTHFSLFVFNKVSPVLLYCHSSSSVLFHVFKSQESCSFPPILSVYIKYLLYHTLKKLFKLSFIIISSAFTPVWIKMLFIF